MLNFFILLVFYFYSTEASVARFGEKTDVYDESHLKMHIEEIDVNKKMSEADERFHYFDMYDLNKDRHIDGIELLKVVQHDHKEGDTMDVAINDEEIEKQIDDILKEVDLDGDGMINYSEYIKRLG